MNNNLQDEIADYKEFLSKMAIDFRVDYAAGRTHELTGIIDNLRHDMDNKIIRDVVIELKIATKAEFERAMKNARIKAVLGCVPANPTELVEAYVDLHHISASYDGMMTRKVPAIYRGHDGKITYISREERENAADVDLYASFHCDARNRLNRLDMERELRILVANYRMAFSERDIADAVEEWMKAAQRERLYELYSTISFKEPGDDPKAMWVKFAEEVFDCEDTGPEFVAAVLRKFIWQIKRKLRNRPVTGHLMPVLLGPQGIGKSTLVNRLLEPVNELKLNIDFSMVCDERNVEIWSSYIMFLDEMGYASKADIETVKNIITAETLTRRPMRSNGRVTFDQKATFIGCSNKEISQLINDPTGIRRFIGIRMRSDADRRYINELDVRRLWGCVSVDEIDPTEEFSALLKQQQEESRQLGRVEQWMVEFHAGWSAYQAGLKASGNISAHDLYLTFRQYEEEACPGHIKTSKSAWDSEMSRLRKNAPDSMIFDYKRGSTGMMYRWKDQPKRDRKGLRVIE